MTPIRLHQHALSGHSHRARLGLSLLGLPHTLVDVDLLRGAHKSADFLELNAFGQVPVLDDGGTIVPDSNAILVYLARRYDPTDAWLPRDPVGEAAVQRWLSVAAGQLAAGPASARLVNVFGAKLDAADLIARSHRLLAVLEASLNGREWIAADRPTIADIALYTYTAHAPEGGVSLAAYPAVQGWLARFEALPGFVPMQRTPVGLAAA